jgi:hypothetical protein
MPIIPSVGRLRQEDLELDASLDNTERTCLKKKKKKSLQIPIYFLKEFWFGTGAHTYNPSYMGGMDQEENTSRPACSKS